MTSTSMNDIPSFDDANTLTEWVIDTAAETGINAYTLWLIVREESTGTGEPRMDDIDAESIERRVARELEGGEGAPTSDSPNPRPADEFDWYGDERGADVGPVRQAAPDPGRSSGEVVTQREYEQFKEEVQGLIQNLIDFLISYDMLSEQAPEEREALIGEFESLTRDFEHDVTEFFGHLERLLSRPELTDKEQPAGDEITEDDELDDLADQLQSSISELQSLKGVAEADTMEEEEAVVDSDPSSAESDEVRQVLGRLNRLLDEVNEYPDGDAGRGRRSRRSDQWSDHDQRQYDEPRDHYDEYAGGYGDTYGEYEGRFDEAYDEYGEPDDWYDDRYDDRDGVETEDYYPESRQSTDESVRQRGSGGMQAPAFSSHETHHRYDRREHTTESAGLQLFGLLPIDFAWLGAGIAYGGLDMFSTALVLRAGGTELNPLFDLLGGSIAGFVLWKTFVLFLLFVFFYPNDPSRPESLQWWVPILVTAAGIVLTVSNIFVLIG